MPEINKSVKEDFLKAFGAHVKQLRKSKKLTQQQLASLINGDTKKIGRIERGCYEIKLSSVLILAQALNVPTTQLLHFKTINSFQDFIWI